MATPEHPRAESYRDAATERSADSLALLEAGRFSGAIWVAGVAVEAIFRAYHRRRSDQLDTGHDLKSLYRASRFAQHVPARHAERIASAIGVVAVGWRHRFRYDPAVAIRRTLEVRPDQLERRARMIVNAAQEVVSHGVLRWDSKP
jgi:hypothetical protein